MLGLTSASGASSTLPEHVHSGSTSANRLNAKLTATVLRNTRVRMPVDSTAAHTSSDWGRHVAGYRGVREKRKRTGVGYIHGGGLMRRRLSRALRGAGR